MREGSKVEAETEKGEEGNYGGLKGVSCALGSSRKTRNRVDRGVCSLRGRQVPGEARPWV